MIAKRFRRYGPSSLGRRTPSLWNHVLSPRKGPSSLEKHMFQFVFNHSHLLIVFIYFCALSLEIFQKQLQFCSWKQFDQNSYAKVMIKNNLDTFIPQGIQLLHGQLEPFSLGHMVAPQGNISSFFPKGMIIPWGQKGWSFSPRKLKLPLPKNMTVPWGKANFPEEPLTFPREVVFFTMATSHIFCTICFVACEVYSFKLIIRLI